MSEHTAASPSAASPFAASATAATPARPGSTDDDVRAVAETYFRSWAARDFGALGAILADEVTFRGPLGSADDKQDCLRGLRGMSQILEDVVIHRMAVVGDDVLTWFDLHTSVAPPTPTVNWSTVVDGRIVAIRGTFDPRAILAAR